MMRSRAALLLLLLPLGLWAQYPYTRTLEVRTGQQRPAIGTVVQDAQGLLWVGSDVGLFRTDGEDVALVLRTEAGGVNALAVDGDAVLAAMGDGLVVRCTGLGCDTLINDSLLGRAPVRALAMDGEGRLWLASYGAGVWIKGKGTDLVWITSDQGLPDDHVNGLCLLPDGRMVAATDQGIAVCDGPRVAEVFGESRGAPDNLVLSVAVDATGNIWAGTDRSGAFRWRPGTDSIRVLDPQWVDGPVGSVAVRGELVWLGTRTRGAVLHDLGPKGGSYRASLEADGRPMAALQLLFDADGAVWWCDGTERLHRADPAVLVVPEHEGVDLRHVTAICTAPDDRIWFATPQGVFTHPAAFSERSWITRVALNVPANTPVVSLAAAHDGTVWAATFGQGAYSIDAQGKVAHHTQAQGLANDNVLAVRAGNQRTWFATLDGLSSYADGRWQRLRVPGPGFVYDVLPMPDGRVYAATDGNGVLEVGKGEAAIASTADGPRTFYALVPGPQGQVWAAGPGSGLCRITAGALPACTGSDRPPFDGNLFAVTGALGRLIAFGSTGTTAFDPVTGTWTDLTQRLGLDRLEAELNAVCTEPDGTIWLACNKGLVRIRPTERHFDPAIRAVITGATVGGRNVPVNSAIRVPYDRNDLTIRFTGLNYADPGAVRFAFQLGGHDAEPMLTRDRNASWFGLPPGDYTFQVRAFTTSGPEDQSGEWTTLRITIEPPWWRLPWVIAAAVVLAAAAAFLLLRLRDRRLRYRERMEQEKVRFQLEALRSQVDPHFLFNSFNALVELIETDTTKAVEHVDQLSTFFRNILQVRDKELIPLAEELELLHTYFALEQRRFGDHITLRVDIGEEARHRCVVPLTTQLLVENALKHNTITAQSPLTVELRTEGDDLVVENVINARRSPSRSTGFGLESITKRYAALSQRPVQAGAHDGRFIVRIPLIDRRP